jgi:hypothetical protein
MQKFAPAVMVDPQAGQALCCGVPHCMQNFAPSGTGAPHPAHATQSA